MGQGFSAAYEQEEGVNSTSNPSIHEVDGERRHVLRCTTAAVALLVGSHTLSAAAATTVKGKPLGFTGYTCSPDIVTAGQNRVFESCVLQVSSGEVSRQRLFSGIIERDGRFKIISYANDM